MAFEPVDDCLAATYGHSHHAAVRARSRWQMPMQREGASRRERAPEPHGTRKMLPPVFTTR